MSVMTIFVPSRRQFLASSLAFAGSALGRDWSGLNPVRYPDEDIVVIDPAFKKYKVETPIRDIKVSG